MAFFVERYSTPKGPNLLVEIGVLALLGHRFRGKIKSKFGPHELQLPGLWDTSTAIKIRASEIGTLSAEIVRSGRVSTEIVNERPVNGNT